MYLTRQSAKHAGVLAFLFAATPAVAVELVYEPGVDPGVGFNLVSWFNFGSNGNQVWTNAVQDVYDAGFREVSLSPVRFAQLSGANAGHIQTTSTKGPELSHVEAGILHAKSLGMTVTLNPFVELVDGSNYFSTWRGFYNPTPGSAAANNFWADYETYMVDAAQIAQSAGADYMTVGTEYKTLVQNSGHNADWANVISAIDSAYTGPLGYAANWDNYKNNNLKNAIWDNPAIDFVGIDAYFRNVTNSQADNSGTNPNPNFISQVESAWDDQLDNDILPYVQSLQGGSGLPVAFTEIGYLPYNRGVAQNAQTGNVDQDEQIMGLTGLMNAMDGRQASDDVLSMSIWQWGMPGSDGSLWNMNTDPGANQPNNIPGAQYLSDFVSGAVQPPPTRSETLIYSWESGLEGWEPTTFYTTTTAPLVVTGSQGATDGTQALSITQTSSGGWSWNATELIEPGDADPTAYQALSAAAADPSDFLIEFDITFDPSLIDSEVTLLKVPFAIQSDAGWGQIDSVISTTGQVLETQTVSFALSDFDVLPTPGSSFYRLVIALDGNWSRGNSTILIDNFKIVQLLDGLIGDLDGDGFVGINDLNLVLGAWNQSVTAGDLLAGDPSGDGFVGIDDLNTVLGNWNAGTPPAVALPEPGTAAVLLSLTGLAGRRRRFMNF